MGDEAVQHREVEGCESDDFKEYFKKMGVKFETIEGGWVELKLELYGIKVLPLNLLKLCFMCSTSGVCVRSFIVSYVNYR